jgi:GNAT superfamily N-acetyltransferase
VSRLPVIARPASIDDVPALAALWAELKQVGGRAERAINPASVSDIADRLAATISDPDCRVLVATADSQPAGMAVLRVTCPDPLSETCVVQLMHLVVAGGQRRRGVGHALVAAAADFADERQIEHLTAGVYPSLRDASRFYARLGFSPVLVQRVAPVAAVRRRLGIEFAGSRDDVVRRSSRLRRPVPSQRLVGRLREPADRV